MSLLEQQIVIGRCLRAADTDAFAALIADASRRFRLDGDELAALVDLVDSPGFAFTRRVQRSWCLGRAAAAAQLTLSILPSELQNKLVADWVAAGGGAALDPTSEADAFLEFIASRLPDPSHALTVCRTEQATYRANEAAARFRPPDMSLLDNHDTVLGRGRDASLVRFLAEPQQLFDAIAAQQPLPPLPPPADAEARFPTLFAPGLPNLWRPASKEEAMIWDRLGSAVSLRALLHDGHSRDVIAQLFGIGAIDSGFY